VSTIIGQQSSNASAVMCKSASLAIQMPNGTLYNASLIFVSCLPQIDWNNPSRKDIVNRYNQGTLLEKKAQWRLIHNWMGWFCCCMPWAEHSKCPEKLDAVLCCSIIHNIKHKNQSTDIPKLPAKYSEDSASLLPSMNIIWSHDPILGNNLIH
jgi:hypothetical protein